MKIPCSVIRDLLPLYAEKMVEPETENLVAEHLADCSDCRQKLSALNEEAEPAIDTAKPLLNLKKQIRIRRRRAVAIAALCVFIILITVFCHSGKTQLLDWQEGLVVVNGIETITPDNRAGRSYCLLSTPEQMPAPDQYTGEALILKTFGRSSGMISSVFHEEDGTYTLVLQMFSENAHMPDPEAWRDGYSGDSELEQLKVFRDNNAEYSELVLYPVPDRVIYGYGNSQKLLWGEPLNGGRQVLPRLSLAYYLLIAAASAVVSGLLWFVFREKKAGRIMRQVFFAPVAYLMAHLLLKGTETTSYFMGREVCFILMIAIALYCLFTLAWQVWIHYRHDRQYAQG